MMMKELIAVTCHLCNKPGSVHTTQVDGEYLQRWICPECRRETKGNNYGRGKTHRELSKLGKHPPVKVFTKAEIQAYLTP